MKKYSLVIFIGGIIVGAGLGYLFIQMISNQTPDNTALPIPPTQAVEETNQPTPVDTSHNQINLTSSDGITLQATYYPPKNGTAPADALLLLHEAYQSSESWHSFAIEAQERGYAVLALDLRGHGRSGGEQIFDEMMDDDVDAALSWLNDSPDVNKNQISIAGASLGSDLALRAGARHQDIKSVAMLSPGMQLWEIGIAEAIIDYGSRPLLLIASEKDGYPANTVRILNEQALGDHQVQLYPGAEHGAEIIKAHPELTLFMLDWFQGTTQ